MFKNESLAAYGCVKATVRSTKTVTLFYVLIITALHMLVLYFPNLFSHLIPELPDDLKSVPTGSLVAAGLCFFVLLAVFIMVCSGYRSYALSISRGSNASFSDLLAPFRSPLRCISAAAVITLFLIVSFAVCILCAMVSVLLFAIAVFGVCFVMYLYRPLWFVIYEQPECPMVKCFQTARHLTRGKRKALFLFDLYFLWFPFLASLLPYFIFSIPTLFPSILEGMPYGVQELVAVILGEIFSAVIYIWKFDYVSAAHACFYNEMC